MIKETPEDVLNEAKEVAFVDNMFESISATYDGTNSDIVKHHIVKSCYQLVLAAISDEEVVERLNEISKDIIGE